MKRYLEVINGVALGELESSGELPERVLTCTHKDEDDDDVRFFWNPQSPPVDAAGQPVTMESFQQEHQLHPGFQDRRIVDVTGRADVKLFMDYNLATGQFSRGATFAKMRPKKLR